MSDYPEIFVMRHGQTEWNRAGRHQGQLDSPLTELGIEQAAIQGRLLHDAVGHRDDVDALTSPQGRASHTAKIALADLGIDARPDPRLMEIGFGQWQGLTFDEMARGWPEHTKNADTEPFAWHFQAPGGESFDAICDRAMAVLNSLAGPTILVTHGVTSRILRGLWLGLDMDGMQALPGGQGCVYHLSDGDQRTLG